MDCTKCNIKSCRSLEACAASKFNKEEILNEYHSEENQKIIQAAATLVDNGRGGTLGRLEEVAEFYKAMNYSKMGLAYCWGMEAKAAEVVHYFSKQGIKVASISCTAGGLSQEQVNQCSENKKVSCNPFSQAEQMNQEGVDFAVTMGLCMGHDILFNRHIKADVTNILVKDRVFNHMPLEGLKKN